MSFSNDVIITLAVCGAVGIILPAALIVIGCIKFKKAWKPSAAVGAGVFVLFALILEQLMHAVMLPIVGKSAVGYVIYGALAAGIFEETGRFVACLVFRKKLNTQTAILGGLGHGGAECAILIGFNYISYVTIAVTVNSIGFDKFVELSGAGADIKEQLTAQLTAIAGITPALGAISLFERLLAMTAHVCLSVIVVKSVSEKKWLLFPAAIILHALPDAGAAMYQAGIIKSIAIVYAIMVVVVIMMIFIAIFLCRKKRGTENDRQ